MQDNTVVECETGVGPFCEGDKHGKLISVPKPRSSSFVIYVGVGHFRNGLVRPSILDLRLDVP